MQIGPDLACPDCGRPAWRVIYYGLPGKLCTGEEACGLLWGWATWVTAWLPFNGKFMLYQRGKFWSALWHWLTKPPCEECG